MSAMARWFRKTRRSGQAIVFILMALVILLFVALWSADIHRIIFVKDRSQNAGDAAAMAAARWQGSSLNLMGELNLMHALALALDDHVSVSLITNTQIRLCFTGPMSGMAAAQQAAKLNGIPVNQEFTEFVRSHATTVRHHYTTDIAGEVLFPEPYPDAWNEYATMLEVLASDGIAAGPDNAVLFTDHSGGHTLMQREFYEAVAGRTWCWFYLYAPGLLESYTSYTWWPGLPAPQWQHYGNSEFFALGVDGVWSSLRRRISLGRLDDAVTEAGLTMVDDPDDQWSRDDQLWFIFDRSAWSRWDAMDRPFPVTGSVRSQYDYQGADAIARVQADMERMTPGTGGRGDAIIWSGAAKAFGYLEIEDTPVIPNAYNFVIPAFRDVRLMPIDAASVPGGGSFDLDWRRHQVEHLPVYMERGPSAVFPGCWYCAQLVTWENPGFRREGVEWLRLYSDRCVINPSGPGGPGGGTRRAH